MPPRNVRALRRDVLAHVFGAIVLAACADPIFQKPWSDADGGQDGMGDGGAGEGGMDSPEHRDAAMPHEPGDGDGDGPGPMDGGDQPQADSGVRGPDATVTDEDLVLGGPAVVAAGRCAKVSVERKTATPEPMHLTVEHASLSLFSDAACEHALATDALLFESGATEVQGGLWIRGLLGEENVKSTSLVIHGPNGHASLPVEVRRAALAVQNTPAVTCFVLEGGRMQCVGDNSLGTAGHDLGDLATGSDEGRYIPAPRVTLTTETVTFSQISMAGATGCGIGICTGR